MLPKYLYRYGERENRSGSEYNISAYMQFLHGTLQLCSMLQSYHMQDDVHIACHNITAVTCYILLHRSMLHKQEDD